MIGRSLSASVTNRMIGTVSGADGVGSKSISNRMLLFPLVLRAPVSISELLVSEDTEVMTRALGGIGIRYHYVGKTLVLQRQAKLFRHQLFFLGNSGTSARFLTSSLCFSPGNYFLKGSHRLHQRPFDDLLNNLRVLGATIKGCSRHNFMPIVISGPCAVPGFADVRLEGNTSSQFVTAIILSILMRFNQLLGPRGVYIRGQLTSKPYVSMTLLLLEALGVPVERFGWERLTVTTPLNEHHKTIPLCVETDMTSVSYFSVLCVLNNGSIGIGGVPVFSIQGDVLFVSILVKNNCSIMFAQDGFIMLGSRNKVMPLKLGCDLIPDVAMTALTIATFSPEPFYCNQVLGWRFKETDRILAMAIELRKFGLIVECGLGAVSAQRVVFTRTNTIITVNTYNDHRIGMSCNVVCLGGFELRMINPFCVTKTFSNYFYIFNNLVNPN